MKSDNFLRYATILVALSLQTNSAQADNIFQRIFSRKDKTPVAQPLPADSFDVQTQPGIKVDSKGKAETRSYLTIPVKEQLGSTKKTSKSTPSSNTSNVDSSNSPISVDTENGSVTYDPTDGMRTQMIDKVNFLKEQAGNSAYFNSLYSSSIFTYSMRKAYFESADGSLKNLEQTLILDNMSDPSKFKLELNDLQLAFFNSMVRFISENPALGGKPLRGFEPKIWNALVQVLLSNTIPMTPDGVLLLPYNDEYEFRFADYKNDRGTLVNSTLVLVDRRGNLLDETGRPIIPRSFKTLGEPSTNGVAGTYEDTVQDWTFMDQLQQVAPTLVNAFTGQALFIQNKPQFDSFLRSQSVFTESMSFADCFRLWMTRQNPDISVADCFKQGGSALGNEIETWAKEGGQTFLRGGIAGAGLSKAFMGINGTAGFLYGGLANVFGFMYNRYLKKEKISPTQINNLISFVSSHTFKQGQWGVIQPGTDKGLWGVTHSGLITRYRTLSVRTFVGRDADGTIRYAVKDKNVRLDLAGKELSGISTVQFNDVFTPANQYNIKKAALQMEKSGGENGLAGLVDPQLSNPDQPMTMPDSATFMKENSLNWVADPQDAISRRDNPMATDDKLSKNVNEEVKVDSVKPVSGTPAPSTSTKAPGPYDVPLPQETSSLPIPPMPSTPLIPTAESPTAEVQPTKEAEIKTKIETSELKTVEIPAIKLPPQE